MVKLLPRKFKYPNTRSGIKGKPMKVAIHFVDNRVTEKKDADKNGVGEDDWKENKNLEMMLRNQTSCPFEKETNLKVNLCELFPDAVPKKKWFEEFNLN
jgi:hypothetical protein